MNNLSHLSQVLRFGTFIKNEISSYLGSVCNFSVLELMHSRRNHLPSPNNSHCSIPKYRVPLMYLFYLGTTPL